VTYYFDIIILMFSRLRILHKVEYYRASFSGLEMTINTEAQLRILLTVDFSWTDPLE